MLIIKNFFYFLSATDKEVITEFPSESNKRIAIGVVIFWNALLITFAMSFSFYYITESYIIGIGFGILASVISILLNRFFVIIPKNSLFPKLLFVFLSLVFAVIISVSLEVRIFKNEIDKHIIQNRAIEVETFSNNIASEVDKEILFIRNRREELYRREDSIQKAYIKEISGAEGSGKMGVGKNASLIKEQLEETRNQINDQNYNLNDLLQRRDVLVNPVQALHEISVKDNSFLSRIQALNDIRATNQLVNITSFMLILLVFSIEVLPFFTIMFSHKTGYDTMMEIYEKEYEDVKTSDFEENQVINSRIKLPTFADGFFTPFDFNGSSAKIDEFHTNGDSGFETDVEAIKNDWKFINKDWRNVLSRYGTRQN